MAGTRGFMLCDRAGGTTGRLTGSSSGGCLMASNSHERDFEEVKVALEVDGRQRRARGARA